MNSSLISLNKRLIGYILVVSIVLVIDRVSKYWMMHYCSSGLLINKFLSFSLSYNKGISWSFLSTDNALLFNSITFAILIFIFFFGLYTRVRFVRGELIMGELLILAGGISNIIDRFFYQAVTDFIVLSYGSWSWPTFNIADMAIVFGCLIMFYTLKD